MRKGEKKDGEMDKVRWRQRHVSKYIQQDGEEEKINNKSERERKSMINKTKKKDKQDERGRKWKAMKVIVIEERVGYHFF